MRHKTHYIAALVIAGIATMLAGCEEKDSFDFLVSKNYLKAETTVSISGDYQSKAELKISADCAWKITSKPSWLDITPSEGTSDATVQLTVNQQNNSGDEDSGEIIVTMTDNTAIKQTVTVTRGKSTATISLNKSSIEFTSLEGSESFEVDCNNTWTISGYESESSWLNIDTASGKGAAVVTVSVSNNSEQTKRGPVTLTAKDLTSGGTATIEISQAAYSTSLVVDTDTIAFDAYGGTKEILVNSSDGWTIECVADWLSYTPDGGKAGISPVAITASANMSTSERQSYAIIKNSANSTLDHVIVVTQEAGEFELAVSPEQVEIDMYGGAYAVSVRASHTVSLELLDGCNEWLNVIDRGTFYEFSADGNYTKAERYGRVLFTMADGAMTATVEVRQEPIDKFIFVDSSMLSFCFDQFGNSLDKEPVVYVDANPSWNAYTDANWLDLYNDGDYLIIQPHENTDAADRKATVYVCLDNDPYNEHTVSIDVYQMGATIVTMEIPYVSKYEAIFIASINTPEYALDNGFVYSTDARFSSSQTQRVSAVNLTGDSFGYTAEDLTSATTYYVYAYAITDFGIIPSEILTFTTSGAIPQEGDNTPPDAE